MLGSIDASVIYIDDFVPVPNAAPNPAVQFIMDPIYYIPLVTGFIKDIVGIVHSHPLGEASPSEHDLQTAWHDLPCHCIFSLLKVHEPELKAFSYGRQSGPARSKQRSNSEFVSIPINLTDN